MVGDRVFMGHATHLAMVTAFISFQGPLSHIAQIQTQVRDPVTIQAQAACRLGLSQRVDQTVKLFSASQTGPTVQLSGCNYPVVCDASGQNQIRQLRQSLK